MGPKTSALDLIGSCGSNGYFASTQMWRRSNERETSSSTSVGNEGQPSGWFALMSIHVGLLGAAEVLDTFPGTNLIYVGGVWNGYTWEAKEYCLDAHIGLYNTGEINGALHRDDFWAYHRKVKDGNPTYPCRF